MNTQTDSEKQGGQLVEHLISWASWFQATEGFYPDADNICSYVNIARSILEQRRYDLEPDESDEN